MHCDHHPTCPGCPLLDLPYADQLAAKRRRLVAALDRYPHLEIGEIPEVVPAVREEGYRHRLKLPVDSDRSPPAIGLYDREGRSVLDTPDCPVLEPRLREGLMALRTWLDGRKDVHSVDLRVSDATGELQAVLAVDGGSLKGGKAAARDMMERVPGLTSVAESIADPDRKRVMGRRPQMLAGKPHLIEQIGETRYRLLPGSFFQVDPQQAARLHDIVRAYVGEARTILDLYAGVGAYALALAPGRKRVVAVEQVSQAAKAAMAEAPENVGVIIGDVAQVELKERVDVAILNPARRGSDPDTLMRVAQLAERIVYVSCGPETLARDLDILASVGHRVAGITPIDLFPQTPEVETVVHLVRGPAQRTWKVGKGRSGSPWHGSPSGAIGRPTEVIAMVVGDPGVQGTAAGSRYETMAMVATHGLIKIEVRSPIPAILRDLARRGNATVGLDRRTAAFFASKAGLVRPFVHIRRADDVVVPLHGDLVEALIALGAPERLIHELATMPKPERKRRR